MDEKMRILRMVEQGTVTAEQAAELMAALNADAPGPLAAPEASGYDKKLLRVLVESAEGDNVKIQFPVGAIKKIVKEMCIRDRRWAMALALDINQVSMDTFNGQMRVSPVNMPPTTFMMNAVHMPLRDWLVNYTWEDGYQPFDKDYALKMAEILKDCLLYTSTSWNS